VKEGGERGGEGDCVKDQGSERFYKLLPFVFFLGSEHAKIYTIPYFCTVES
jgi:hypothetical protein